MSNGRAMFGSGPGALPSDARTLGIDPMVQRDRQDEALSVIILRLLRGEERFSYKSEWFELNEARLQLLPVQEDMPMVAASSISPSGMTLAGKYGMGVLSIASNSTEGISGAADPVGLRRAGRRAARPDRRPQELARDDGVPPRRVEASRRATKPSTDCSAGTTSTTCTRSAGRTRPPSTTSGSCSTRPPAPAPSVPARRSSARPTNSSQAIRHLQEITGGFGVVLGFAHDWANREATLRSWDLLARYVIPEINGSTTVDPRIAGVPARQPGRADGGCLEGRRVRRSSSTRGRPRRSPPRWPRPRRPPPTRTPRSCRSSAPAPASRRPTDRERVINLRTWAAD